MPKEDDAMIGGLHRLVLFCRDTEASKQWYERVGFTYKHGHDGMHWFALGEGEIMLHPTGLHPAAPEPESVNPSAGVAASGGPKEVSAIHTIVPDVDALFAHVRRQGLTPFDHQEPGVALDKPVVRPWGDREFELTDPDGHRWAFTEPAD